MSSNPIPEHYDRTARAVLGAAIAGGEQCSQRVLDEVPRDWLLRESDQLLYDTIRRMFETGTRIDELTFVNELTSCGALEQVGGSVAVYQAIEACEVFSNLNTYIAQLGQIVRSLQWQRIAEQIGHIARTEADPAKRDERCAAVATSMLMQDAHQRNGGIDAAEGGQRFRASYGADAGNRIKLPWRKLNDAQGGVRGGQIVVLGGYPGAGKSWDALAILECAVAQGKRVGVFSMEMNDYENKERLLAMGGLSYSQIQREQIPIDALEPRLAQIDEWSYTMFEGETSLSRIKTEYMRSSLQGKPFDMLIIDHLQLMEFDTTRRDYRHALDASVNALKPFANGNNVAIVLLSQLRRGEREQVKVDGKTITTHYPPPRMSSFKESGAIEAIADYALGIWRIPDEHDAFTNDARIFVLKQRGGERIAPIKVRFNTSTYRFEEQDAQHADVHVPAAREPEALVL